MHFNVNFNDYKERAATQSTTAQQPIGHTDNLDARAQAIVV